MLSRRAALGTPLLLSSTAARAQVAGFPGRPVRIVVPYPPGGPNDLVARASARSMTERWGRPVVVENRPGGAAGVVGTELVARSEPDGHTLVLNAASRMRSRPGCTRGCPTTPPGISPPSRWSAGRR